MIFTNGTCSGQYYSLLEQDMYLPRLLKQDTNGKFLSFQELLSPPVSMFSSMERFQEAGVHWIDNTSEELETVTREMIAYTGEAYSSEPRVSSLQQNFKDQAESCGLKYGGRPVKAFAPISKNFLERHADLL